MSFLLKLKGIRKEYYLTLIIMLFFSISGKAHEAGILDLRCEYIDNPIGIDTPSPRFSWKISADQRGVFQKAYQIIVGEKMDEGNGVSGKCWDSGIIKSDQTVNIEYGGISLRSDQKYFGEFVFGPMKVKLSGVRLQFFIPGYLIELIGNRNGLPLMMK